MKVIRWQINEGVDGKFWGFMDFRFGHIVVDAKNHENYVDKSSAIRSCKLYAEKFGLKLPAKCEFVSVEQERNAR